MARISFTILKSVWKSVQRWVIVKSVVIGKQLDRNVKIGKKTVRLGYIVIALVSACFACGLTTGGIKGFQYYQLKRHNPTKAEVQSSLQALLEEHVTLLATASRSLIHNQADYQTIMNSLDANSYKLSERIGSVYGKPAGEHFLVLWKGQITSYLQYTKDAKDGYKGNAQKQLPTLTSFPEKLSSFFMKLNPKTQQSALKSAMSQYVAQMKTVIDTYVSKDFAASYNQQSVAVKHMNAVATIILDDMVAGSPNAFR